jgi:hypothetical protein
VPLRYHSRPAACGGELLRPRASGFAVWERTGAHFSPVLIPVVVRVQFASPGFRPGRRKDACGTMLRACLRAPVLQMAIGVTKGMLSTFWDRLSVWLGPHAARATRSSPWAAPSRRPGAYDPLSTPSSKPTRSWDRPGTKPPRVTQTCFLEHVAVTHDRQIGRSGDFTESACPGPSKLTRTLQTGAKGKLWKVAGQARPTRVSWTSFCT